MFGLGRAGATNGLSVPAVPTLTSVRTNRYEMGRHAITMVIDAIEGRRPPEPVIDLGFQLMIRESSMPQTP